jgi:hypothetical protein
VNVSSVIITSFDTTEVVPEIYLTNKK